MGTMQERLTETKRGLQAIGKSAPEFAKAFQQLKQTVKKDGALDKKTKSLIGIVLSIVARCEWCISIHVKEALDYNASPEEIMETVFVTALMGGAPALMEGQLVMKAINEFTK
ncbi:MAG: carboxymuconolactone decarboxylase family protein [Promethearchaeota archaeon]